ncbi:MAG: LuxR family transcriptional regulator [Sneathiella sp.]|nr:LuxR family transcriptional regulator [Sneathiella sp.]
MYLNYLESEILTPPTTTMASFFKNQKNLLDHNSMLSFLRIFCEKYGFSNATYFSVILPSYFVGDDVLITTYSEEWVSHYFLMDYKYIDPVLSAGNTKLLPFNWCQIPERLPGTKKFFGTASDFGISNQGMTVPIRGADGEVCMFSVNADYNCKDWDKYCKEIEADLIHIALLFHTLAMPIFCPKISSQIRDLSRREKETLFWAAKGKTAWETAQILGLTERTVSFYSTAASKKLNAVSKTHAVAKALKARII